MKSEHYSIKMAETHDCHRFQYLHHKWQKN